MHVTMPRFGELERTDCGALQPLYQCCFLHMQGLPGPTGPDGPKGQEVRKKIG